MPAKRKAAKRPGKKTKSKSATALLKRLKGHTGEGGWTRSRSYVSRAGEKYAYALTYREGRRTQIVAYCTSNEAEARARARFRQSPAVAGTFGKGATCAAAKQDAKSKARKRLGR